MRREAASQDSPPASLEKEEAPRERRRTSLPSPTRRLHEFLIGQRPMRNSCNTGPLSWKRSRGERRLLKPTAVEAARPPNRGMRPFSLEGGCPQPPSGVPKGSLSKHHSIQRCEHLLRELPARSAVAALLHSAAGGRASSVAGGELTRSLLFLGFRTGIAKCKYFLRELRASA
jgi:hypothetical protein